MKAKQLHFVGLLGAVPYASFRRSNQPAATAPLFIQVLEGQLSGTAKLLETVEDS